MTQQVDTLIHARWIIPAVPEGLVLTHHSLAIDKGRIEAVLPTRDARERYSADHEQECSRHALIPGLINAHTHASMSLLRGLADDMPLMQWLNEHIWPAEGRWVSEEFVADGTRLAIAEMLRGGTTCFNDMYFFPDITAKVCSQIGMRAVVGLILIDFPSAWAENADDYLHKGLALNDQLRANPLIHTAFAPHAPYSVSDAPLQRIQTLADELELAVHMHVHETRDEVEQGLQNHGMRPLQRLQQLGLLSPSLAAVHMTQLTEEEIELIAESGASVVHCPESNLKLASGFCPVESLRQAGINVALGTDGAASNNDLDMFSEMRSAALLAKGVSGNASALPAAAALGMATINGARALGIDEQTGSLEAGKSADVTAVDLGAIESQPIYHPLSQLVYSCGREQVSDVWIAGRQLLKERTLTNLDLQEILYRAGNWGEKIARSDPA